MQSPAIKKTRKVSSEAIVIKKKLAHNQFGRRTASCAPINICSKIVRAERRQIGCEFLTIERTLGPSLCECACVWAEFERSVIIKLYRLARRDE